MNLEIVHLGPVVIYTYGMWLALAFLAAAALAGREAARRGQRESLVYELIAHLMAITIVAGRLGYVLPDLLFYLTNPLELFRVSQGGLSYLAAFAAGLVYVAYFAARHRIRLAELLDILAPGLAVGLIIGSLGALDAVDLKGAVRVGSFYWPPPVFAFFTIEYAGLWYLVVQQRRMVRGGRFWLVVKADALARCVSSALAWLVYGYTLPGLLSLLGAAGLFGLAWWQGALSSGDGGQAVKWSAARRRPPTVRTLLTKSVAWFAMYIMFMVVLARSVPAGV